MEWSCGIPQSHLLDRRVIWETIHSTMIQKHKRKLLLLLASALLALSLSSCGTMQGLGEDISGAGRGLQKAAS